MKKLILILVLCPILMIAQTDGPQDITGVWRVTASSWNEDTKQFADCEMIKFISKTRWASLFYWPKTKKFAGTGGGTYEWKDGTYIETCEYFTWDTSAVGSTQPFKMIVKNGKLIQEGRLNTDKYKYPYYAVHERMDKLNWVYENQKSPQGVWGLVEATFGTKKLDQNKIKDKFGQCVKIITPNYFISTMFDKGKKKVDGVTFGTYSFDKDGKYQETVRCWSWDDQSMVGTQPSFDWEISEDGNFHQKGYLNSETYKDHLIDEHYKRVEPLRLKTKVWTFSEQKLLINELGRTKKETISALESLTDEQWNFKEEPDRWSIAEVAEHLEIQDEMYFREMDVIPNRPETPEFVEVVKGNDSLLLAYATDPTKGTAGYLEPIGRFCSKDDTKSAFIRIREMLINTVRTTKEDLRLHFTFRNYEDGDELTDPGLYDIRDLHQLMLTCIAHTDRHLGQIERIKAHPDYPKDLSIKGK